MEEVETRTDKDQKAMGMSLSGFHKWLQESSFDEDGGHSLCSSYEFP